MPLSEPSQITIKPAFQEICAELERTWYEKIPITNALGVSICAFDGEQLHLEADFEANINLHGTAFAGSLYAVTALCGWSMVHLQLARAGLSGSIVLAEGNIRYSMPVRDSIVAVCKFGDQHKTIEALKAGKKKGRFGTLCSVSQDEATAALFEGSYVVVL